MPENSILIVTRSIDDHAPLVRAQLNKMGAPFINFNTDKFMNGEDIFISINNSIFNSIISIDNKLYDGCLFKSVLFRHLVIPRVPEIDDLNARALAESERKATLIGGLLALTPNLWMNHPQANQQARHKLVQLRVAASLGFNVPDTLVSAQPRLIRERFDHWQGQMVAKLAGGQIITDNIDDQFVIYTTDISKSDLEDEKSLEICPSIYQKKIKKQYELRVTIIGNEIFTCRIDANDVIDWRSIGINNLSFQPYTLDPLLASACFALVRHFNLEIAGIDLIVTPDGEVYFLEINASGQWLWVEQGLGLPIAAAIAARLAAACRAQGS